MKNGVLYVNDKEAEDIKGVQYEYQLIGQKVNTLEVPTLEENYRVTFYKDPRNPNNVVRSIAYMHPDVAAQMVKDLPGVDQIERRLKPKGYTPGTFPYNGEKYPWNIDHYGPITIPKKGTTINLSMDNIELYTRLIAAYEGNDLKIENGKIYINGEATTTYTPKLDYYWMMGDNRNNSADSRSWGFVPEDHIVGKPLFVWLSLKNGSLKNGGVRWDRLFMGASGR